MIQQQQIQIQALMTQNAQLAAQNSTATPVAEQPRVTATVIAAVPPDLPGNIHPIGGLAAPVPVPEAHKTFAQETAAEKAETVLTAGIFRPKESALPKP